jgi:3'-phosphoadenosine 5'-phosphosulfate sulfotransferase (PAPS reductase)/FAD synthetase
VNTPPLATTPEVDSLIAAGSPVALGVSGGKDSCALAFAVSEHLDAVGHAGPRLLIHSDLGRVEWKASGATCERLAGATGAELLVVRRAAGDMMDRWLGRWANNVERYRTLSCVRLILPWSTPAMRFCTSELKTDVICRALVKRFPGRTILSASGIRRDESPARAKAPVSKPQDKLTSATHRTAGLDWHPLADWSEADVWASMAARGFEPHEAYTRYGASRVSCAYCIMSAAADLRAAAGCADNHDLYREMVALEAASTFAFQGGKWLADVSPGLLTDAGRAGVARAKWAAGVRAEAEARIPKHLLYTKGWPTCVPTGAEAESLASVRRVVADAAGIGAMECLDGASVVARYEGLMREKAAKGAGKAAAGPQPCLF